MAVPDSPLELDVDLERMTFDDSMIFDPSVAETNLFVYIGGLRRFLLEHSKSWTREEIGALEIGEMQLVANKLVEALKRIAIPLAKSKRSKPGRAARSTRPHPPG